jgi:hypothetical protein
LKNQNIFEFNLRTNIALDRIIAIEKTLKKHPYVKVENDFENAISLTKLPNQQVAI